MYGINEEQFEQYIQHIDNFIDKLKPLFKELEDTSSTISDIFRENGLDEVANMASSIEENNSKCIRQLSSYSTSLREVKKSYQAQEEMVSESFDSIKF